MIEKLTAVIFLIRPLNFVITFVSVFIAAFICKPDTILTLNLVLAAFAASVVLASGNIINDIKDVEVDRINRPGRPLPSGKISRINAYTLYLILVLISILISFLLNEMAALIVLLSIVLLFVYSKYLKQIPLVGNTTVSFLTGLVFIYGGVVVGNPSAAIIPAVFAFLINFIRELIKDMQDVEGDKKANVVTFPIKYGFHKSKILILLFTILLILFTTYPFISKLYKIEYFVIVMVIVNPILVYCLKILFEENSTNNLKKISNLLKLGMIFGLLVIYVGL